MKKDRDSHVLDALNYAKAGEHFRAGQEIREARAHYPDDEYIGSEKHFQDIINASWDAREANGKPAETLGEAGYRLRKAFKQLTKALAIEGKNISKRFYHGRK